MGPDFGDGGDILVSAGGSKRNGPEFTTDGDSEDPQRVASMRSKAKRRRVTKPKSGACRRLKRGRGQGRWRFVRQENQSV